MQTRASGDVEPAGWLLRDYHPAFPEALADAQAAGQPPEWGWGDPRLSGLQRGGPMV